MALEEASCRALWWTQSEEATQVLYSFITVFHPIPKDSELWQFSFRTSKQMEFSAHSSGPEAVPAVSKPSEEGSGTQRLQEP